MKNDRFERVDDYGDGETGIQTRGLIAEQELLAAVILLAMDDCKRVLKAPAWSALTVRQILECASAARFLLSLDGKAMIMAFSLGRGDGMEKIAITRCSELARSALDRLQMSEEEVLSGPNRQWARVIIWSDATSCAEIKSNRRFHWPQRLQKMLGEQANFSFAA